MTNREYLAQMSNEDLADWLCKQIFPDYRRSHHKMLDVSRFHTIRNFLKMEYREENKDND